MKTEIICCTTTHAGWSNVYTPIGYYLDAGLSDYGDAIESILMIAHVPKKTGASTKSERELFGPLPKTVFRRKKRAVEINFLSTIAVAANEARRSIDVALCNRAMPEVAEAISAIKSKLKRDDDFDFSRFYADVVKLLQKPFSNMTAIEQAETASDKKRAAAAAEEADPWESADVDWDDDVYHPDARSILDDPFFWSRGSSFAPHGSDTGSDVLDIYAEWRQKSSSGSADQLVVRILRDWGIPVVDRNLKSEREAREYFTENESSYRVSSEVAIAVAFAELKYTANCPKVLAERALRGIANLGYPFVEGDIDDVFVAEFRESLRVMKEKLKLFA